MYPKPSISIQDAVDESLPRSQGCNITSAKDFIRLIFLVNVRLDREVFSNVTFDLLDVYFSEINERHPVCRFSYWRTCQIDSCLQEIRINPLLC